MRSNRAHSWRNVDCVSRRLVLLVSLFLFTTECRPLWAGNNVWTMIGPAGGTVWSVVVDPQNPNTVYAGIDFESSGVRLFMSSDGGATWSARSVLPNGRPVGVLAIDPQNPRTIYTSSRRELFKSTDGGDSWVDTGLSADVRALAIDPKNSEVVYAGTFVCEGICGGRVFKSIDGGNTWITPNFAFTEPGCSWTVSALAIDQQNTNTVYATTSDCNDQGGFLFKSKDGGATWKRTSLNVYGYGNSIAVDPGKANTIYAAYQGGVARSTDGGESWSVVNFGLPRQFSVSSLGIDRKDFDTLYAAGYLSHPVPLSAVFKSIDGGANWVLFNDGLNVEHIRSLALPVSLSGHNTLYAATSSGLFKIIDDKPVVSMDSAQYCLGSTWKLKVSNGAPSTTIRLLGTSNGQSWEVAEWRKTDANGNLTVEGNFAKGTEGSHSLRVEIGGAISNLVSFVISNCTPVDLNGTYLAPSSGATLDSAVASATTHPLGDRRGEGQVYEVSNGIPAEGTYTPFSDELRRPQALNGIDLRGQSFQCDVDLHNPKLWQFDAEFFQIGIGRQADPADTATDEFFVFIYQAGRSFALYMETDWTLYRPETTYYSVR